MGLLSSIFGSKEAEFSVHDKTPKPAISDEENYIRWLVLYSPDTESLRSLGQARFGTSKANMEKFAEQMASLCMKFQRRDVDTGDKMFQRVLDLSSDWRDFQGVVQERGGFGTMRSWPFPLVETAWQIVGQVLVYRILLVEKYRHRRATELFDVIGPMH
jgi:hypothetical protein